MSIFPASANALTLETCRAQGISPEVPFKGSLNVRLGADLHRRIAIAAAGLHVSINKFIADTLERAVFANAKASSGSIK